MLSRCRQNQNSWQSFTSASTGNHHRHLVANSGNHTLVFPCILSALQWISQGKDPVLASAGSRSSSPSPAQPEFKELREAGHTCVLVTGSLHLVGGVLKHLEPSLDS
ncbi:hypothetical protein LDENG_00066700 [Lucifuga dentata]|nr:hypothetical protein LDENG_00066700 [Lucifuga dentata]